MKCATCARIQQSNSRTTCARIGWLPQRLIAELYQIAIPTVNEHLANIYAGGKLNPAATIREFRTVQSEGARRVARMVHHYTLDAILAVDYRVRSAHGTQFRQWGTNRLSKPLERIRDISKAICNWATACDPIAESRCVVNCARSHQMKSASPRYAVISPDSKIRYGVDNVNKYDGN